MITVLFLLQAFAFTKAAEVKAVFRTAFVSFFRTAEVLQSLHICNKCSDLLKAKRLEDRSKDKTFLSVVKGEKELLQGIKKISCPV